MKNHFILEQKRVLLPMVYVLEKKICFFAVNSLSRLQTAAVPIIRNCERGFRNLLCSRVIGHVVFCSRSSRRCYDQIFVENHTMCPRRMQTNKNLLLIFGHGNLYI